MSKGLTIIDKELPQFVAQSSGIVPQVVEQLEGKKVPQAAGQLDEIETRLGQVELNCAQKGVRS